MATPLTYGAFKLDMRGSIHSDERCPVCGSRYKSVEPMGLFCPNHPKVAPTTYKVYFEKITRRFNDYKAAYQFLTGLRYERGSGKFDVRDYQINKKPLSFDVLVDAWLNIKKQEIKHGSYMDLKGKMAHARQAWGDINIKLIDYGQIEDLLKIVTLSPKSKKDLLISLRSFFNWVKKRHNIDGPNDWPKIGPVEMKFRNTIDLSTQESIIQDIEKHEPFKAWLAIKLLATYISIRPGEMISLTEQQVDRHRGLLIIPHPKEKKPKIVPLTTEDAELIKSIPVGLPTLPFFRHGDLSGANERYSGKPFGLHYLSRVWQKACIRLGVNGVDLYGGTKHSTAMGMREVATFEEVRTMTGHTTNKAFERYFRSEGKDLQALYERRKSIVSPDNGLTSKNGSFKKNN